MISRKVLVLTCIFFIQICSSFTSKNALLTSGLGRLKFQTMIIQRDSLAGLLTRGDFKALFFNSFYDKRGLFHKDRVSLNAFISGNTLGMQQTGLQQTDYKGDKLKKERAYSSYILPARIIDSILTIYKSNATVQYFLLEPVPYEKDDNYIAYDIYPAGNNKRELESIGIHTGKNDKEETLAGKLRTNSIHTNSLINEDIPEGITRVSAVAVYRLNPSPPYQPSLQ